MAWPFNFSDDCKPPANGHHEAAWPKVPTLEVATTYSGGAAVGVLVPSQPAVGPTAEQPAVGPTAEQPAVGPTAEQPAAGVLSPRQPAAIVTSPAQPAAGQKAEQPAAGAKAAQPAAGAKAAQPAAGHNAAQPAAGQKAAQPAAGLTTKSASGAGDTKVRTAARSCLVQPVTSAGPTACAWLLEITMLPCLPTRRAAQGQYAQEPPSRWPQPAAAVRALQHTDRP